MERTKKIEKLASATRSALQGHTICHKINSVDDDLPCRTILIAEHVARVAVTRKKEGQTKGLLYRMQLAKYTTIITIEPTTESAREEIATLWKEP